MWITSLSLRLAGSLGLFLYRVECPVERSTALTPACHVPTQSKPVFASRHTERTFGSPKLVGLFGLYLKLKTLGLVRSKRLSPPDVTAHNAPDSSSIRALA